MTPIYNDQGQMQNLLLLIVESTEAVQNRRRLAAALQQSEERARELETVINQIADGVVIADAGGRSCGSTRRESRCWGAVPCPARRTNIRRVIRSIRPMAGSIPGTNCPWRGRAAGTGHRGRTGVRRPDGSEHILSVSAAPLTRDDGTLEGAVAVMRDVTELKEAERLKDEFFAIVSHELRTPLSAILGYSDILLRGLHGPLNERQARAQMRRP